MWFFSANRGKTATKKEKRGVVVRFWAVNWAEYAVFGAFWGVEVALWCDFWRSMGLFGGAEEKEVPLTRPRIWKRAVNGAGRTDKKQSGLTLRQRRSKNDNTQSPKEDTYFFRCKDRESFEVAFCGVVGTKNGCCSAYR